MRELIQRAAGWVRESPFTVALTGAGISVDSGIPDFRSAGGLWERFDPMEYATIRAFRTDPEKVWSMLFEMHDVVERARPNPGHHGLAYMERLGFLHGIVTQNIDNLHQEAGSKIVVEYHGNAWRLVCLTCRKTWDARRRAEAARTVPRCDHCRAILKPDVVFFGEDIPAEAARSAYHLASQCRLMLVVGTSAAVYPAAELPLIAKARGAKLVEINTETTGLTGVADASIRGPASQIVPTLVDAIRAME